MMEWITENATALGIVGSVIGVIFMHGRAIQWLKTIAERLDRHVTRNDHQHEKMFYEQKSTDARVARLEAKVDTLCPPRE